MTDDYMDYTALTASFPGLPSRRRLEAASRAGLFPPYVRLRPHGAALWRRSDWTAFLERKFGAAQPGAAQ
ncbi:MAG: hypothetical protein ACM3YN_00970 [Parcubacteria group bacterium]